MRLSRFATALRSPPPPWPLRPLRRRPATLAGLATLAVTAALLAAGPVRAQVPPVAPGSTTTTTPTPAPSPGQTTTTQVVTAPTTPGGAPASTTTTAPSNTPSNPNGTSPSSSGPAPNPGDVGTGTVPPQYLPLINSVRRGPPTNDKALLDALQPLIAIGLPPVEALVVGMGRFPVAGYASFADDFLEPRFGPPFHLHQGNDVFAQCGLPIRSPADGVLRLSSDPLGGSTAVVTMPDGTYFYMAHLSAYVAGQQSGLAVRTGQIVGFVGNTGDAAGGACHVHFEIHPKGGAAVDPNPFLNGAITGALALVPRIVALYQGSQRGQATAPIATGQLLGALDGGPEPGDGDLSLAVAAGPARDSVLWAASAAPAGGALGLATAELGDVASTGWSAAAIQQAAGRAEWSRAEALTALLLGPTTPPLLRGLLGAG